MKGGGSGKKGNSKSLSELMEKVRGPRVSKAPVDMWEKEGKEGGGARSNMHRTKEENTLHIEQKKAHSAKSLSRILRT